MVKLLVVATVMLVPYSCGDRTVPEVHKEGSPCTKIGDAAVDSAGWDVVCVKNSRGHLVWTRTKVGA